MPEAPLRHRANATFVMLARNSDIDSAVDSVREMEDRFNRNYNYPWVFLNEKPFSTEFKRCALYPSLDCICILTPIAQVGYRYSPRGLCILARSLESIGTNPRGSTKPRRGRREIRWTRRKSYTVVVYRAISFTILLQSTADARPCTQVSQYVPI
jgi:hypothetical protein